MGLDVYVGTLTRYYAGHWETIIQQAAREQGREVKIVRTNEPEDAVTDPAEVEPAVLGWRTVLSRQLAAHLPAPLDWPEGMAPPYFTDKPGWDGFAGLLLWAAYLEQPHLRRPARRTDDLQHDPALAASTTEGFRSRYMPALNCELWLPGELRLSFHTKDVAGQEMPMTFTHPLLQTLDDLNERTWQASPSDIAAWLVEGPARPEDAFDRQAQFGFAVFHDLAGKAVANRLPMKLDY